ncbi:hypothetical protein D3C87_1380770 [compost metagenome]
MVGEPAIRDLLEIIQNIGNMRLLDNFEGQPVAGAAAQGLAKGCELAALQFECGKIDQRQFAKLEGTQARIGAMGQEEGRNLVEGGARTRRTGGFHELPDQIGKILLVADGVGEGYP